jgi:hypothetical protein
MNIGRCIFFALCSLFLFAASSHAGYIQTDQEGTKTFIQEGKIKILPQSAHEPWIVMDLAEDAVTIVDVQNKRYTRAGSEEYCQMMNQMMQVADAFMQAFTQKDNEKHPPQITVDEQGSGGSIAGMETTHYKILEDGQLVEELWLTKDSGLLKEFRQMKYVDFMQCMAKDSDYLDSAAYSELLEQGWPMKTLTYFDSQPALDLEVISMKKTDIPQSEFQVPDGYSNVPMKKFFHLDAQEEMQMPSGEDMKKMFEEMGIDPENLPEMFQQKQ